MKKILTAICAFALTIGATCAGTFNGTIRFSPSWTHTFTSESTVKETFDNLYSWTHTDGTNVNQMSQIWHDTITVASGTSNIVDITGGITNAFGEVLTMGEVSMLFIHAASANTDVARVGGGTGAISSWFLAADDEFVLRPNGVIILTAPDATGYASGSGLLRLTNPGASNAVFTIYLGGSGS